MGRHIGGWALLWLLGLLGSRAAAAEFGKSCPVELWGTSEAGPGAPAPSGGWAVVALRGEQIDLQLAVRRRDGGLTGPASLDLEGPRGRRLEARLFREAGPTDDRLLPQGPEGFAVPPDAPVTLWAIVAVPADAAAGDYRAEARLGGCRIEIGRLRVAPLATPQVPALRVVAPRTLLAPNLARDPVLALAVRHGLSPEELWGLGGADWSQFEEKLGPYLGSPGVDGPGIAALVLPDPGAGGDLQRFQALIDAEQRLRRRGFSGEVVAFGGDEFDGPGGVDRAAALHRAVPGVELVMGKPAADLGGLADATSLPFGQSGETLSLDSPAREPRPTRLWWTLGVSPGERLPTLAPGGDRRAVRAIGWMAYENGVVGLRLESSGAGAAADLVGRGLDGQPVSTVRLERLRQAVQDYGLLKLAAGQGLAREARLAARQLSPAVDRWPKGEGAFEAAREGLVARLRATARRPSSAAKTRRSRRSGARPAGPGRPPGA